MASTENVIENYYDKEVPSSDRPTVSETSAKRNLSEDSSAHGNSPKRVDYDSDCGTELPEGTPVWAASLFRAINGVKEEVATKFDDLTTKFNAYKSDTDAQFCAINNKIDSMKSEYEKKIAELTESVTFVTNKYDEQMATNTELADKISELVRTQDYASNKSKEQVYNLECAIEAQEQYSRRNCLLLHGVTETKGENTDALVMKNIKDRLGITLQNSDLDRSHRIGAPRIDNKARPIIIKFNRYNSRAAVYGTKKKLKGTSLLLTESLTRRRTEVLNASKKRFGIRNVWTFNGEIFTKLNGKMVNVRSIPPTA